MKRGAPKKAKITAHSQQIQALTDIVSRANLAFAMGKQYGGDRDVYQALGYDLDLTYSKYLARYARQAMARAVINRPIAATWRGGVTLMEADKPEDTALEKEWIELSEKFALISKFTRVDRLTILGHFGILLLGLSDISDEAELQNPVTGSNLKLLYVKPLGEGSTKVKSVEEDPTDERYGQPLLYQVDVKNLDTFQVDVQRTQTLLIHHSRVIHITGELLESEIYGAPVLQSVYNNLMDLDKVVGGSAEMYWRGARPGMQGKIDEDFAMTPKMEADLQAQIDEFEHNLRRMLINEGITFEQFAAQISDPTAATDVQIQMISAVTGIPKRILTGTERGELASTQDTEAFHALIVARRQEYAEPRIVRPFIDRCIEYKILPALSAEKYMVQWEDPSALGVKEKAEVALTRAKALKEYGTAGIGQDVVPADAFALFFLGLEEDEIELLKELREVAQKEEEKDAKLFEREEKARLKREAAEAKAGREPTVQRTIDSVDWKKVYEDNDAHWAGDLQPSKLGQSFAEKLVQIQKESILEIGCGNGRDSILFALAGLKVTAIDIVSEAIDIAKENVNDLNVDIDFQVGDAEALKFDDVAFDAIYSISVLHSTDMEKSISEISRVLKFGGIALIHLYSNVEKIDGTKTEFVSPDEFIELLKENGFTINDIYTTEDEEFDEAGEKHLIIVTEVSK